MGHSGRGQKNVAEGKVQRVNVHINLVSPGSPRAEVRSHDSGALHTNAEEGVVRPVPTSHDRCPCQDVLG